MYVPIAARNAGIIAYHSYVYRDHTCDLFSVSPSQSGTLWNPANQHRPAEQQELSRTIVCIHNPNPNCSPLEFNSIPLTPPHTQPRTLRIHTVRQIIMKSSLSPFLVLSSLCVFANSQATYPDCVSTACTPLRDVGISCGYDFAGTAPANKDQTKCICGRPNAQEVIKQWVSHNAIVFPPTLFSASLTILFEPGVLNAPI